MVAVLEKLDHWLTVQEMGQALACSPGDISWDLSRAAQSEKIGAAVETWGLLSAHNVEFHWRPYSPVAVKGQSSLGSKKGLTFIPTS